MNLHWVDPDFIPYFSARTNSSEENLCERSILFSMGAIHRIEKIERQNHFQCIRLGATNEIDAQQLPAHTKSTQEV